MPKGNQPDMEDYARPLLRRICLSSYSGENRSHLHLLSASSVLAASNLCRQKYGQIIISWASLVPGLLTLAALLQVAILSEGLEVVQIVDLLFVDIISNHLPSSADILEAVILIVSSTLRIKHAASTAA